MDDSSGLGNGSWYVSDQISNKTILLIYLGLQVFIQLLGIYDLRTQP